MDKMVGIKVRLIFTCICLITGFYSMVHSQTIIPLPDTKICNDYRQAGGKLLAGGLVYDPDIVEQLVIMEKSWNACDLENHVRDVQALKVTTAIDDLRWAEGIWINDNEIYHIAGWTLPSWEILELKVNGNELFLQQRIFRSTHFPEPTETSNSFVELASGTMRFAKPTAISGEDYQRRMVYVERNRYQLDKMLDLSRTNFFGRTKWARGKDKLVITDYLDYPPTSYPRTRTFTRTSIQNLAIVSGLINYKDVSSFATKCLHDLLLQEDSQITAAFQKTNLTKSKLARFYDSLAKFKFSQNQILKSSKTPLAGSKEIRRNLVKLQERILNVETEESFKAFHEVATVTNGTLFGCEKPN